MSKRIDASGRWVDVHEELGEDLGDFRGEIVAVGSFPGSDIVAVPAIGFRQWAVVERQGRHGRLPRGVEEVRKRQSVAARGVSHPVRRRTVPAAREALEQVAEVADDRPGGGCDVDPCAFDGANLEPTDSVLSAVTLGG